MAETPLPTIDHEHSYIGDPKHGWYSPKDETHAGQLVHTHDQLELHRHWLSYDSPHQPLDGGLPLFRFSAGEAIAELEESY